VGRERQLSGSRKSVICIKVEPLYMESHGGVGIHNTKGKEDV